MNNERKWMVTLDEDTYTWVRRTAEELQMHGSDIIKELILRVMSDKSDEFRDSLLEARGRMLKEELEQKKAEIEEQLRSLSKKTIVSGDHKVSKGR